MGLEGEEEVAFRRCSTLQYRTVAINGDSIIDTNSIQTATPPHLTRQWCVGGSAKNTTQNAPQPDLFLGGLVDLHGALFVHAGLCLATT